MSLPYAVVYFPQEEIYSEIPCSWLTKDGTQCRWPPAKNATFLLKKKNPPQADWMLFDVKVEGYCETLGKARKRAEGANYTSCDESKGLGKRIIFKKIIDSSDSCDDDADDDSDVPPQIYETPHKKLKIDKGRNSSVIIPSCGNQVSNEKQSSCEQVLQLVAEESLSPSNRSLCGKLQTRKVDSVPEAIKLNDINELVASGSKEVNVQNVDVITAVTELVTVDDVEKLFKMSVEILKYVKSIDKRLKTLERGVDAEDPVNIFDDILPIDSIQDLKMFEEKFNTAETRENFVEFMKKVGGKGNKNLVQRCMKRIFTNKFGVSCSWCGRRQNFRMCYLKCISILKGVLRTKGVDECEFETIASEWFRLSKLRYDRENKGVLAENRDPVEIKRPPTNVTH